MVGAYSGADVTRVDVRPVQGPIGHMGYFSRRSGKELWSRAMRWVCGLRETV